MEDREEDIKILKKFFLQGVERPTKDFTSLLTAFDNFLEKLYRLFVETGEGFYFDHQDFEEEELFLLWAADDEVFPFRYYAGWTETFPMLVFFFVIFFNGYWLTAFLIFLWDEADHFLSNSDHIFEIEEDEHRDVDEYDNSIFDYSYSFYDSHTYEDFEFLYYVYANRYETFYYF